ncbi:MAG: TonB-dependent receptor family protein, partial [Gemmatimonadales bacterium]
QQPDTLRRDTLPPITVSVTRSDLPLRLMPRAVETVSRSQISRARPTWGLDEALAAVPGVYAANRYNFSVDQRLSIRGFGARSAFAVRGIKVLLDGIPQTLPDGQGQLTNLELGEADRIEVLRGPAAALFGNASGGVISISTLQAAPRAVTEDLRVVAGAFDGDLDRAWTKWQSTTAFRVGGGGAQVTLSRLDYEGERDHTEADFRNLNARLRLPVLGRWSLALQTDWGDQPLANNPGGLTLTELKANRDSAARLNILRDAGKDVHQVQAGVTLQGPLGAAGEATVTLFGLTRDLTNPLPQAYITVDRRAYGARASASRPVGIGGRPARLTAGLDLQWQRDDRQEFNYVVPNAALTTPDNRPDTLTRNQLEQVREVGPFAQALIELSPTLSVMAGLRYDRVSFRVTDRHLSDGADNSGERVMDAVSGSVGVAVSPSAALTVYANVGNAFETPTTTELNNQPPPASGGFNPDLDPQRAWSYELGARGRAAGGRVSWSVALFQADVRDELIAFEDSTAPGRRFFRNAAAARHRGAELGAELRLAPGVALGGAWTYAHYRYTEYQLGTLDLAGRAIPGLPEHWLHLRLRAAPEVARGAWVEVATTYSSDVLVNDTLAVRAPNWWMASLRVGWDGTVGGLRLSPFVAVQNVFDRTYVGSVVINATAGRYYEPAPGRNAYVGFSLGGGR